MHSAGEERPAGWATGDDQFTMTLLVDGGPFRVELPDSEVVLVRQGDYVMWGPGTGHCWRSIGAAAMLTVRWRG